MEPDWKKPLSLPELPAEEVLSAFLKYMVGFCITLQTYVFEKTPLRNDTVSAASAHSSGGCRGMHAYLQGSEHAYLQCSALTTDPI